MRGITIPNPNNMSKCGLEILEAQLVVDDIKIADWIHITLNVDDVVVIKCSRHVEDGIAG